MTELTSYCRKYESDENLMKPRLKTSRNGLTTKIGRMKNGSLLQERTPEWMDGGSLIASCSSKVISS
jgi:hypothetical protein